MAGDDDISINADRRRSDEWPLSIVVVAITDEKPASRSGSGEGMIRSAETSPFYA